MVFDKSSNAANTGQFGSNAINTTAGEAFYYSVLTKHDNTILLRWDEDGCDWIVSSRLSAQPTAGSEHSKVRTFYRQKAGADVDSDI